MSTTGPEMVDILVPPTFKKSGVVKSRHQAYDDGDWIGGINLWVVQAQPVPAFVYQQRSATSTWEPNKLDVSAAGHYSAGEIFADGLREAEEELGKAYQEKDITRVGTRLNVGIDTKGRTRHNVLDIGLIIDGSPLTTYRLDPVEVQAIVVCPLVDLERVFTQEGYSFVAPGLKADRSPLELMVTRDSFPYNWDNYHYKMTLLAKRFLQGEKNLVY
jgi:hypothetical protein